ncbi:FtsW/RodA/SpoVE family cell cycle protein [Enterococcus pseudoavium]|uniref:FtsW/RodA/SpoVE family cell cycle protein n=1 Tax=Enterococcus pseudoavium TaxID=44007 RepID=A0AAE4I100_9ENTE|nr:FtsW/RodA/SpoVE family cell cycle protein [Enterococcus pseudoavium]MDT2737166.1 FtsW/RodA/SpoVE family cell cycle protein [Enterococcus pseudoavium]MDT2753299.1 FtsW/RodA/SpoVE family cell cycle protein [Enterococcus pseudoavium]REC32172.1 FtsW/RodA/SpoVE family cell cycle protein [Enterococcus pseudoavium]
MDRLRRNNDNDSRIDYGIILPVFILCLIGLLSLYVALSHDPRDPNIFRSLVMQTVWYVVGALAIVVIIHFDAKLLWRLTPFLYVIGLAVMLALLKYYDPTLAASTGSKNWFKFGTLTFQPSELMKIAYILMMALTITKHNVTNKLHTLKNDLVLIGKLLLVTIPVLVLVLAQKDFGTMLVFLAIFAGMFLISGISWLIVIPVIALAAVVGISLILLVATDTGREMLTHLGFKNYQFARIDSWLEPFHDPQGESFQLAHALMAIGSGGLFGTGYNVSHVYVPVRESDMIFTVIGENFGFVGGAFVILIYFILIYRMIRLSFDMNNEFYAYIASGIVMMMLFHVFENIGANIGLLPLTGIPLPFISQGGSSILGNMIGIGLILSMRYQSADKQPVRRTRRA